MARPKKTNADRRSKRLQIRCTADEYHRIQQAANAAQMSISEYVLTLAMKGRIIIKTPPVNDNSFSIDTDMRRTLRGMATNLNQLAKRANILGFIPKSLERNMDLLSGVLEELYKPIKG